MSHIDQDVLALLALGDATPDVAERAHLEACDVCRAELDDFRRVVSVARPAPELLVTPSPAVWQAIAAELGFDEAPSSGGADTVVSSIGSASGRDGAAGRPRGTDGPRRGRQPRRGAGAPRRRTAGIVAAAAVVGIAVGLGIGWLVPSPVRGSGDGQTVVATARLEALPGSSGTGGRAEIDRAADGRLTLVVDLVGSRASGSSGGSDGPLREVWMLRADHDGLVSMGYLDDGRGVFPVPAGMDLAAYPIVDVSAEPDDGDPAHSGQSIARGEFTERS